MIVLAAYSAPAAPTNVPPARVVAIPIDAPRPKVTVTETHGPRSIWEVQDNADALEHSGQQLSEVRAAYIHGELVQRGVPAVALHARGYGATQPLDTRSSELAHAKNRRVTVVSLGPRP